jgi:hypothetical protein
MEAVKSNTVPADFIRFAKHIAYNFDNIKQPYFIYFEDKYKFRFSNYENTEKENVAWYGTYTETYFINPNDIYKHNFRKEFIFWVLIDLYLIVKTENFRYADNIAYKTAIKNDFDIEFLYKDIKKFLKIYPSKLNKKRLKNIKKIKTLL